MTFRQEVIGQFHCKSLLSLEIAKAEDIVAEPIKRRYQIQSIGQLRKGLELDYK